MGRINIDCFLKYSKIFKSTQQMLGVFGFCGMGFVGNGLIYACIA